MTYTKKMWLSCLPLLMVLLSVSASAWSFGRIGRSKAKASAALASPQLGVLMSSAPSSPSAPSSLSAATTPSIENAKAGEGGRDTLALIYDSLHGECATINRILDGVDARSALPDVQVDAIKSLWAVHATNMRKHLDSSETFLLPKLQEHADIPSDSVIKSHRNLMSHISTIDSTVSTLRPGAIGKKEAALFATYNSYSNDLRDHFAFQKQSILCQSKQAMTASQWGRTLQKFMEKGGVEMGSFIHHMGVETFRQEWMSFCKLPSFLWSVYFRKGFDQFQDKWQRHVAAFESGPGVLAV